MLTKEKVKGYITEFEGVVQESLYDADDYTLIKGVANGVPLYIHRRQALDLNFLAMQPLENRLEFVVHNHESSPDEGIILFDDGETLESLHELDFEAFLDRIVQLKVKAHTYHASNEGGSLRAILQGEALSDVELSGHYHQLALSQYMDFVCTVTIVWLGLRHMSAEN